MGLTNFQKTVWFLSHPVYIYIFNIYILLVGVCCLWFCQITWHYAGLYTKFSQACLKCCTCCYLHIHALKHLSLDTAKSVAVCIVASRLDYCNRLLLGTSQRNLDQLQCIHNVVARTVVNATWSVNAAEITHSVHWLSIRQRIHFKLALLAYKARHSISTYRTFSWTIIQPDNWGHRQSTYVHIMSLLCICPSCMKLSQTWPAFCWLSWLI